MAPSQLIYFSPFNCHVVGENLIFHKIETNYFL